MRANTVRGFSMIELLVSLSVIGILVSLLLTGIQAARESSRKLECQNNLRQFGIALQNFASRHKAFPMGEDGKQFPAQVHLLNDLDAGSIASKIDLNTVPNVGSNRGIVNLHSPTVFRCPSDPNADEMSCSYAACSGVNAMMLDPQQLAETQMVLPNSRVAENLGAFESKRAVRLSEFSDGLSQTIAFSDVMVGSQRQVRVGPGRPFNNIALLEQMEMHDPAAANFFAHRCAEITNQHSDWLLTFSRIWFEGGSNNYNNILPPNYRVPDCGRGIFSLFGVRSSRSYHRGGVNSVWGDGRVSFESNEIDIKVWRSAATRQGHETAPSE